MTTTSTALAAGAAATVAANGAGFVLILLSSMGLKMPKETVHQQNWNHTFAATDDYVNTKDATAISTRSSTSVNTTLWTSWSVPEPSSWTPTGKTGHPPPAPYPKTTSYPNMTWSPPHTLPLKTMPLRDSPPHKSSSNSTWHEPPTFNTAPWYPSKPSNETTGSNITWHAPTGPSSYNTSPCSNATWHWPVPPPPKSTPSVPSFSSSESRPLVQSSSARWTAHTPAPSFWSLPSSTYPPPWVQPSSLPESESWSPTAYSPQGELWTSTMPVQPPSSYPQEAAALPLSSTTWVTPSPPSSYGRASPQTIQVPPPWYLETTSPELQPHTTVSQPASPAAPVTVVTPSPVSPVPDSPTNTTPMPTASTTPLPGTSTPASPPESPLPALAPVQASKPVQPAPTASEAATSSPPESSTSEAAAVSQTGPTSEAIPVTESGSEMTPVSQLATSTHTQPHTTLASSSSNPSSSTTLLSSSSITSSWTTAASTSDAERVSPVQIFMGSLLFATACILYVFA